MDLSELSTDNNASKPSLKNFEFTGKTSEFFGIWIVNLVLTIITLGVYSAWAKVRTNQYFYGSTQLDGASFQYLASPIQILKGRLIAVGLLIAYYGLNAFYPIWSLALAGVVLTLVPAIIVFSMSFRMRHTAYRNVTFGFKRNFKWAYFIYGIPALIFFASMASAIHTQLPQEGEEASLEQLGSSFIFAFIPLLVALFFPYWEYLKSNFLVGHTRYGSDFFSFKSNAGHFYSIYLQAFFVLLSALILFGATIAIWASMNEGMPTEAHAFAAILPMILITPIYLWIYAFIQVKRTNLIYSATSVSDIQLKSELTVSYMFYLYITNTIGIIISLGLLIPWSKIRTAKYRAETMSLTMDTDLDQFINQQEEKMSAIGEEFGEVFDIDVGL